MGSICARYGWLIQCCYVPNCKWRIQTYQCVLSKSKATQVSWWFAFSVSDCLLNLLHLYLHINLHHAPFLYVGFFKLCTQWLYMFSERTCAISKVYCCYMFGLKRQNNLYQICVLYYIFTIVFANNGVIL